MALNLDKVIKMHHFKFETEGLGELLCHNFSVSVLTKAEKWLENGRDKSSEEFARYLTTLLCQQVVADEGLEDRIRQGQVKLLTQNDIEHFSKLFIEKNKYLLEERETIRNKDDDGKMVVSFKNHISEKLLKKKDESDTDHLFRVVDEYIKQSSKQTKTLFKNFSKNLFSKTTLNLIKENKRISDSLGSTLIHHEPFKTPVFPKNPIYETNRTLASFGKELKEVAYLIKNMNDLGVELALESATSTARTKFWNNIMFGLGLITLAVTAIFSYLSFISSNDSSVQVERLLKQQNSLLQAQEENQRRIIMLLSSTLKKDMTQEKETKLKPTVSITKDSH